MALLFKSWMTSKNSPHRLSLNFSLSESSAVVMRHQLSPQTEHCLGPLCLRAHLTPDYQHCQESPRWACQPRANSAGRKDRKASVLLHGHMGRTELSESGLWGSPVLSQSDPFPPFPSSEAALGRWVLLTQQIRLATANKPLIWDFSSLRPVAGFSLKLGKVALMAGSWNQLRFSRVFIWCLWWGLRTSALRTHLRCRT